MKKQFAKFFFPILVLGLALMGFSPIPQYTAKVILVDLAVKTPTQAGKCYTKSFDAKSIELEVEFDDTLNSLQDLSIIEDPLDGPECFYPEMKIIYENYTYVVSMYCTSVVRYKNSSPYTPSSKTVRNDLRMTETVLDYLTGVRKHYFGKTHDIKVAENFFSTAPLEEDTGDDINLDEYDNEDEEDELEAEKEALDKEGWFDDNQDEEDPDIEINDDDLDDE